MPDRAARLLHALTLVFAVVALALQLVLVISGESVLDDTAAPSLPERLWRLIGYFTIQANLLVAVALWPLVRDPAHDGRGWRVVRGASLVGITVTALVHAVLLRPLLDLQGWSALADTLLHVVVPLLALLGWILAGPRPRRDARSNRLGLLWPLLWLVYTYLVAGLTGFHPYPFLDPQVNGVLGVVLACLGVTVVFVLVTAALTALDRRLPERPVACGVSGRPRAAR